MLLTREENLFGLILMHLNLVNLLNEQAYLRLGKGPSDIVNIDETGTTTVHG